MVFSVAELVGELIELLEASLEEEATVAELAGASPELEAGATALETGVFALDAGTTALEVGVTSALEAGPGTSELDAGTSETTAEDERRINHIRRTGRTRRFPRAHTSHVRIRHCR